MTTDAWRSLLLIGAVQAVLTTAACAVPLDRVEYTEVHMGVPVRVVLYAADEAAAMQAARAAFDRVRALDAVMSDYRPDSELNRLSATAGEWVPVSAELFSVLALAREIADATGGAFDPTVGPLVALWRESRASGALPSVARLADARARSGWPRLELDPATLSVRLAARGMRLDLGGIAKGFILDRALSAARATGVSRILIEAGGDIVVGDAPPGREGWTIDVDDVDDELARRAAALTNAALATSGASVQFVEIDGVRYSHVVDPMTGLGLTSSRVSRVIAGDGATADALATAIGVAGPESIPRLLAAFPGVALATSRNPAPH
jgi:thiamine biosynthesis lipoprotein